MYLFLINQRINPKFLSFLRYLYKNVKMKKIIKLNEQDLERLVKKVIAEEENSEGKKTTLTKHPAYNVIDTLGNKLEDLKKEFKDGIANAVSGSDGYHSEIDKFSSEFTKFIAKMEDLKKKINDYQVVDNKRHQEAKAKQMQERKKMMYMAKEKARNEGKNYSY
jgi:hypothetical protein